MRRFRQFADDTTGAVAVEFAAVASLFITIIIFVLIIALAFFFKQSLDVATTAAARQVLTGAAHRANMDQGKFKELLCSRLPSVISCANVIVNLYKVPEGQCPATGYCTFVTSDKSGLIVPNSSSSYDLGQRGTYQYLEVIYPFTFLPEIILLVAGSNYSPNGKPAYALIATAAFRNEQF